MKAVSLYKLIRITEYAKLIERTWVHKALTEP